MNQPTDALEQSLIKASHDAAKRNAFFADFAAADVYTILVSGLDDGQTTLPKGASIHLQEMTYNGGQYIPVFSSLPKLEAFMQQDFRYFCIKGRDLAAMLEGRELFLNPGAQYSKIITRQELAIINNPTSKAAKPSLLRRLFGGKA